jgi:hypothetical protein
MEVLPLLRTLWRRRVAVAGGVVAAVAITLVLGRGTPSRTGVAYTRLALDTPRSQLVHAAPAGADTLGWRASLLAHLVATDATTRAIARGAGVPAGQVDVVDPTLAAPAVPSSLPKGVADATAAVTAPYVLSVYEPDGSLPIIAIATAGPDRRAAARLARAAAAVLASEGSRADGPLVQPFVVQSVAPVHARTVVTGGGRLRSLALAAFVLVVWCAGVALVPRLAAGAPRGRRAARAA